MNIKIIHTKNLRWIDVINPSSKEMDYLKENFNFHPLDYEGIVSTSQHTKIENRPNYHFVVLLFPVFNRQTREIRPGEIDFFIGANYLITIHDGSMYTMVNLVNSVAEHDSLRSQYMEKNSGFLMYQILESLFKRSFPILDHINKDMTEIEQNIFSDLSLKMLQKISLMKRNVIDFRRIMKTHHLILKKLAAKKDSYITFHESKNYYGSLMEHAENIWDILAIQKETIEALQDTNQSMAANQLNQITKVITIISAVFLPATFIMFIFGLNLKYLPLAENYYGFWIIIALAFTSAALMLAYFKKKKWF